MADNSKSRFALILKQEREKRQMTLEEMANFLGTTKQVLSRYERGERNPKLIVAATFAQKLGIPIESFQRDIEVPIAEGKSMPLSENDKKIVEMALLLEKHKEAIMTLDSLSEKKREQAIDFLRFLSKQEEKT